MSLEDVLRKEREMLAEHGWYVHYVIDETMPGGVNAHTHGLPERWGHPDFQVVAPLGMDRAYAIFDNLLDRVKELDGGTLEPGTPCGGIINGYDVLLVAAMESGRPVLRVILPDADGNLTPEAMTGVMTRRQWEGVEPPT